ncbi:TraR/DksA family transcriptional regulator [Roseimaritima ulvae]|uniref:General stress protein 16O n=1 Tax=Roseimaritima ulvae TaxID=980254 RepID=A0A5B9QY75_9BACT|nr:TraR/DksA C4-type zinc finger protein [Roseimaritima ulvae]QEG42790.1 General stress protein 16O [Roseimaritima ulvae]
MGARKPRDYQPFENILRALRQRLRGDVQAMSDAALHGDTDGDLSHVPIHMADKGTDAFDQEFTLSLVENEEETLQQIDAALERLSSGQYGNCLSCGKPIPMQRLNAIPYTAHCVHCATKLQS